MALSLLVNLAPLLGQDTFESIVRGDGPQTVPGLWAGFDPRAEPLDTEVLHEWEEEGVVLQVLRYRVGIFKGKKVMAAAVYGFPKGAERLPGLVQIHGGGQYADHRAVLSNAKRGYVTISVSWAGRISAPNYRVSPDEVALFWEGKTDDPKYKVTTDWGALDGYHAPSRHSENVFPRIPEPAAWTLDAVKSARNNAWFLGTLAARRALTFLERQPQVDPNRLGVYGHSMGGKLTVLTAGSDARVKAAAPSCGGVSDRYNDDPVFRATLGDDPYLKRITCPIVFLSPANDFHGRIHDLQAALDEIATDEWRVTCSAHHNHQDNAEHEVATQLWFDQYLRGDFTWPTTPVTKLELDGGGGTPRLQIHPDPTRAIVSVDVFYTQDADPKAGHYEVINRFWHHTAPQRQGDTWVAVLPLAGDTKPLWAYANVTYKLENPVAGAGYYYRYYTAKTFVVSSRMTMVSSDALRAANVKPTQQPSSTIESFRGGWRNEWFTYRPERWPIRTHRVNNSLWSAPTGAKLAVAVRAAEANSLVIGIDGYAAVVALHGNAVWQEIVLQPGDFQDARGDQLAGWDGIRELRFGDQETLRERRPDATRKVGSPWQGADPEFRNLHWTAGD